jgi:2-iminobutanoate/2-iminopropanoate deaminase
MIVAEALPPAPRPYSYAVQAGDWVFTAGMLGFDRTGEIVGAASGATDAAAQTRQALDNLAIALGALGVPLAHVAKVKGYLTDFRHVEAYNTAYRDVFAPPWPARATAGAGLVRDHGVVEIEAVAAVRAPPREVRAPGRAAPPVPLSQGMQAAGVLFVSGQLARDASGALVGRGDHGAQAVQALHNLGTVLAAGGLGIADVVQIHTTVTDRDALPRYDEAFAQCFTDPRPAHAIVQGAPGVDGMLIEIEAVALRGPRQVVRHARGHAVQVGALVHLAGHAAAAAHDVRAQTRETLQSLRLCLEEMGGRMDDVVKTTVTLADRRLVPAFNEAYREFFTPPYPARTTVTAGVVGEGMLVAIEGVAILGAAEHAVVVTGAR